MINVAPISWILEYQGMPINEEQRSQKGIPMLTDESPKKLTDAKNERLSVLRAVGDVQRLLSAAAAGLLAPLVLTTAVWAQSTAAEAPEADSGQATAGTLRTLEDMQAYEAVHPAVPVVMPPNLPTMDFQQYLDLKKIAPATGEVKPGPSLAPAARPILGPLHCAGLNQTMPVVQGFAPPDTHGAVGANHYGQIVNSAIRFYSKGLSGSCPTSIVMTRMLSSFFGYSAQALFDPRILYDLTYNRWIVSAEAFPESATVQHQFIAASVDSDPTHGFFIYNFNARNWVGHGRKYERATAGAAAGLRRLQHGSRALPRDA
jgi:hypothetical protein